MRSTCCAVLLALAAVTSSGCTGHADDRQAPRPLPPDSASVAWSGHYLDETTAAAWATVEDNKKGLPPSDAYHFALNRAATAADPAADRQQRATAEHVLAVDGDRLYFCGPTSTPLVTVSYDSGLDSGSSGGRVAQVPPC